ncbi:hypothetical protein ACF0H5_010321 [Mactra antiquata]
MNFVAHWKHWIRPLGIIIYFVLMMIAVPLCIIEVTNKDKDKHVKAWFTGGVFTLLAVPISLWEIILHVINYTKPHLQKYIIRIIWMVPIYALNAWFALRFKSISIYLDTVRECYEAYVIYNFMAYLLSYLWTEHPQLHIELSRKPQQKHLIPFCCFPPWPMGIICELNGKYHEGDFDFQSAWSYLVIINNISQVWAMYCLILFYRATRDLLAPIKPVPKFLCVKFVVFFSFWQAVVIAVFAKFNLIPETEFYDYNVEDIAKALQDFCICIEMFLAAVMHYFAFSHKPFIDPNAEQGNCCQSFLSMWDVSDLKDDVVEHVQVIKKTVSGPFRPKKSHSESTPLLNPASNDSQPDFTVQTTQAEVNPTSYQGQPDALSNTSEWDVTSVDRWQTGNQQQSRPSVTSSMHNYLDLSSSMDNQSVLSCDNKERLSDRDSLKIKHRTDSDQTEEKQSDSVFLDSTEAQVNKKEEVETKPSEESLISFEDNADDNNEGR